MYYYSFERNSHLPTFEHFIRILLYTGSEENSKDDKLLCEQNVIKFIFFTPLNFEQLENSISFRMALKVHKHLNNSTGIAQATV